MTTKPEEIALIKDALTKAYNLGQRYWQQADSDYESDHKKSDVTAATFKNLFAETDTSMREVLSHIAAQDAEIARLREALESIALAGMSPSPEMSQNGVDAWHARQAWAFIGIVSRALTDRAAITTKGTE